MVTAYALEARGPKWIAVFALACAATAVYGVASGAWIFAALEATWSVVAFSRFVSHRRMETLDASRTARSHLSTS